MWSWAVRGVLAALAASLVIATVPRSNLSPAQVPTPTSSATEAPVIAKAADTCRGLDDSGASPIPFPARTAAEVIEGTRRDPSVRLLFNDLAGVRPGPMRDPRAPQCRPDLLELGQSVFVRQYPATTGRWLLPVRYQDQTLVTVFVYTDLNGMGIVGGNRGGGIAIPTEAEARAAGGTSADPVTAAELVLGNASCGRDLVMWRLVRQSGKVMYLVPDFPGAAPPGALMTDREVWFSTSGRPVAYAKAAAAC